MSLRNSPPVAVADAPTPRNELEKPVRAERSGWRDQALSDRHRMWGWHCPGLDLDFLFLEYDRGKPTAIVEYKHESSIPLKVWHPSYCALIDLGDRAGLPVFVVRYAADFTWWLVRPLNDQARQWIPEPLRMIERQWVELLYRIRGRTLPESVLSESSDEV